MPTTLQTFGGGTTDFILDPSNNAAPAPNTPYTVIDAVTMAPVTTGLLDALGNAATQLTSDATGRYAGSAPLQGSAYYLDTVGANGQTYRFGPMVTVSAVAQVADLAPRMDAISASATSAQTSASAAATSAAAAASLVSAPADITVAAMAGNPASATAAALRTAFGQIPSAAEQTIFVTVRGNDSNDGLTLKTAKATIAAGIAALGGSPGVVQLGCGNLSTGANHTLPTGTEILGAGRGMTTITYTGTGALFQGTSGTRTYNQVIAGLAILGPGKATTAVAFDMIDVSNGTMDDFTINSFGTGIKHRSVIVGGAVYNHFTNGVINSCGLGVDFAATGSNGSRWHGVKFGACTIAANIIDSNQNNFHACQFEGNGTGVFIDATLAGLSDHNSFTFCRFENNTALAWNVNSAAVRDTEVIYPASFGTYTWTDNGSRTSHVTSGAYASKTKSAVSSASGAWTWERYSNGGSETPAARFVDSVSSSGTPVTVQIETERAAGYFLRGTRGGTTYFDIDASGNMRFPQGGSLSFGGTAVPKSADVQIFTADGTWSMPAGAKTVTLVLVGGGGGGGAGRRGAAGTVRCGGGGGGGGGVTRIAVPASSLAAAVAVTVGQGGSGAAATTADDTSGANGGTGTASVFGSHARANGAAGGLGGSAASGAGGAGSTVAMFAAGGGGSASTTGLVGPAGTSVAAAAGGGGAGGGITTAEAVSAGGLGGAVFSFTPTGTGTGGAAGANGTAGTAAAANTGIPGQGSGGGGSSVTAAAGSGAGGAVYGGGGGGGGASLNGFASGAGGAGGNGIVIVTTTF